jgi:hypothetical protein
MDDDTNVTKDAGGFDWLLSLAALQAGLVFMILVSGQGANWALAAL